MSSKRKLRRAHAQQGAPSPAPPTKERIRRQTADERFAKPGADKLWVGLLGWAPERVGRAWLLQAIHDGARSRERGSLDPARVIAAIEERVPDVAGKLGSEAIENAAAMWASSGDGYDAGDPAPKWHLLSNLCAKVGLGEATPEALQDDWEAWTALTLAATPRAALMGALAQAEQAAVALHGLTQSHRMGALVNLSRAMWTALAYGDAATFELLQKSGDDWLANVAGKLPKV